MNRILKTIPFLLLSGGIFLTSCSENDDDPQPATCNVIYVTQSITAPTTWTEGNVYILDDVWISVNAPLTIEPGVIVKLKDARLDVVSGKIIANGTADKRIVFTSLADDSYCGDNNGDGTATTPQKGDWTCVYLNGGNNNTFKYCDFLYAGQNDGGYYSAVAISVAGPSFTFDHCTFAHTLSNNSASNAYAFHGGSYMSDPDVSIFTNNAFYDNDRPLYCSFNYTVNPNNIFHNPANPAEINKRNGIFMWGGIGANVSYNVSEVPYVFLENFSGGGSGAVRNINIGNNVVLKFTRSDWGIARGNDNIINIGAGAIFTSYKDDEHGGDTNGDGNLSSPSAGDWDGFWDYSNNSYVSAPYILYAGH